MVTFGKFMVVTHQVLHGLTTTWASLDSKLLNNHRVMVYYNNLMFFYVYGC